MCFRGPMERGPFVPPATKEPINKVDMPKGSGTRSNSIHTRPAKERQGQIANQAVSLAQSGPSLGAAGDNGMKAFKRVSLGL